jgi:peptide/nickel transport system permease protein
MTTFLTRRLFSMLLVWLGVSILTFVIANVVPTDPVALHLGPKATPETIAYWRHKLGYDRSLPEQYLGYMGNLLHGDLGQSIWSGRPVTRDLVDYLPATVELSLMAALLTVLAGIPLGVLAATRPGSLFDRFVLFLANFGLAVPLFWLGLVFQLLFYRQLGWLPIDSRIDLILGPPKLVTGLYILDSLLAGDMARLGSSLVHIILPTLTLAMFTMGAVARMVRASTIDTLQTQFIRMAQAKGVSGRRLLWKHVLRNSLLPTVTVLGNTVNALLAGTFVVEAIFNWPGLGWYATRAILASDYAAIVSITLVIAVICTVVNLLVDLLYQALDPRIHLAS